MAKQEQGEAVRFSISARDKISTSPSTVCRMVKVLARYCNKWVLVHYTC